MVQYVVYSKKATYIVLVVGYLVVCVLALLGFINGIEEANAPLAPNEQVVNMLFGDAGSRDWWPIAFGVFLMVLSGILCGREIHSLRNHEKNMAHLKVPGRSKNWSGMIRTVVFVALAVVMFLGSGMFGVSWKNSMLYLILAISFFAVVVCLSYFADLSA